MTDIDLDVLVKRVDALEKELFIVNRYIDTQLRDKYHIQVDPSYWQIPTSWDCVDSAIALDESLGETK